MKILVTGGAGYIGSHTSVLLLEAGFDVAIADNLSNSSPEALERIKRITGRDFDFYRCDLQNYKELRQLFSRERFDAVIHFAGFKAVGESVAKPMAYYANNLGSTVNLARCMRKYGSRCLVFSSSATVYGDPASVPIREDFPLSATNPYGRTKLMIEEMLMGQKEEEWAFPLPFCGISIPWGPIKAGS